MLDVKGTRMGLLLMHRSDHAFTGVSPNNRTAVSLDAHSFICWMHRNNTQYTLFDVQFTYQFQESNVPHVCKRGSVNRRPNTVNARRIPVYLLPLVYWKCNSHIQNGIYLYKTSHFKNLRSKILRKSGWYFAKHTET